MIMKMFDINATAWETGRHPSAQAKPSS